MYLETTELHPVDCVSEMHRIDLPLRPWINKGPRLTTQPLLLDRCSVFRMWIAWTVCCLSKHRGPTAVRSQTPPTLFHTVVHCVPTLALSDSGSRYTVYSHPSCLIPARTEVYLYDPRALTEVTILTLHDAKCLRGKVWIMTGLSQTDTAVPLWHLSCFPHICIKYEVSVNHCCWKAPKYMIESST